MKISINGIKNLTNPELLEMLLDSKDAAVAVLKEYPNINQLDLNRKNKVGKIDISKIQIAIELGKRIQKNKTLRYGEVCSSSMVGEMLVERFLGNVQEEVVVVFLDTKNQIIKIEKIFKGTLNSTTVHPRDIFRRCLELSAAKFIVAHNHPSGVISVSEQDLNFTNRLLKCSEVIGCELLDHLIIGKDSYLSLKEEGLM